MLCPVSNSLLRLLLLTLPPNMLHAEALALEVGKHLLYETSKKVQVAGPGFCAPQYVLTGEEESRSREKWPKWAK